MTLNKVVAAHVLSSFSVCLTRSITLNIDLDDRASSPPGLTGIEKYSNYLNSELQLSELHTQIIQYAAQCRNST